MMGRPKTTVRTLHPHSAKCCLVAILKADQNGLIHVHDIKIATDNVPHPSEMKGGLWCIVYMSSGTSEDDALANLVKAIKELAPLSPTWKAIKDLLSDPDHPDRIYFPKSEGN